MSAGHKPIILGHVPREHDTCHAAGRTGVRGLVDTVGHGDTQVVRQEPLLYTNVTYVAGDSQT